MAKCIRVNAISAEMLEHLAHDALSGADIPCKPITNFRASYSLRLLGYALTIESVNWVSHFILAFESHNVNRANSSPNSEPRVDNSPESLHNYEHLNIYSCKLFT